ncbi:protein DETOXIFICATION 56-like [Typha angustifolia]|uniref:protein DETOXIFICATION 56-like n=1 Tax=Typha angustifolia TaxID=59011 RepID=UPI003C2AE9FE
MLIRAPEPDEESSRVADDQIHTLPRCACHIKRMILSELKKQRGIAAPLIPMNSTWFAKTAITTAFLGRLGKLQLAAGTLGFTFANVTGFSILAGLCCAMESICGQAHGAENHKLLHKTLIMTTILLVVASLPISFLWFYVDKVLSLFGQQREIIILAKKYVVYLLPDLVVTSFLCPLKTYLSSQGITLPIMFSSAIALALHVPFNMFLSKAKGLEGVSLAIGLTDLSLTIMLALYIYVTKFWKDDDDDNKTTGGDRGEWWIQTRSDWLRLLKISFQCCFTGCLEWWCYEIITLLAGRLPDAQRNVAVLTVVLNFDYLLYGVMVSLATCASTRVSNELGGGNSRLAQDAACVSVVLAVVAGSVGGSAMVAARGQWGSLFSRDKDILDGVEKILLLMAVVEVFNFPLAVCGGIVRGTSRPWLGMCSAGGFYLVGLPLAVWLAFTAHFGLRGLLLGFIVGSFCSALLLTVVVGRINWDDEAVKAQRLACENTEWTPSE